MGDDLTNNRTKKTIQVITDEKVTKDNVDYWLSDYPVSGYDEKKLAIQFQDNHLIFLFPSFKSRSIPSTPFKNCLVYFIFFILFVCFIIAFLITASSVELNIT